MHKQPLFIVLVSLLPIFNINAQYLQDTLFQSHLIQDAEFVTGRTYLLQQDKQNKPPSEHSHSPFIKSEETPIFDYRADVTNGIYFSEVGDKPITFLGQYDDQEFIIGKDTLVFSVIRFEINGEQYKSFTHARQIKNNQNPIQTRSFYRNLTEQSFTESIRNALVGKTVYTLSGNWMQYNEKYKNSNHEYTTVEENTFKYYPVKITAVINDYDNKYVVFFQPEGTDKSYCFINVTFGKEELRSSFNFWKRMTFENPRKRYPGFSNKQWKNIQSQSVEKGMTTEEIKTAFGEPYEKYETNEDDVWIYYNEKNKDMAITFRKGKIHEFVTRKAGRRY